MISLRSGLCILARTGVSLQEVVPLGIHTNVNTYAVSEHGVLQEPKVVVHDGLDSAVRCTTGYIV